MMKQNSTPFRVLFAPAVIIWLAALILASKYDLKISESIADPMSGFGRVLEIIGEPPAILFTSFNFSLIIACLLKKPERTKGDLTLAALSAIGMVGAAFYTVYQTFKYIAEWRTDMTGMSYGVGYQELAASIMISAAACIAMLAFAWRLEYLTLYKILGIAARCVFTAITTLSIIWCLKLSWGRVRFRQMTGNYTLFTPWYLPRGFNGYYSFPSGHTANAAVIFTLTYYLRFLPEKRRFLKPVAYLLLSVWIILLAYSRVRVGAHYLSDVLFGAAITLAIVYFWRPKESVRNAKHKN